MRHRRADSLEIGYAGAGREMGGEQKVDFLKTMCYSIISISSGKSYLKIAMEAKMLTMVQVGLLLSFFILSALSLLSLIHEFQIDPPVAIAKRRFGEIVWVKIVRRWIMVIPYIESIESFSVEKFLLKITMAEVLAQDNVSLEISSTLYLEPDPDNLLAYLKSGKEDGVKRILAEIAEQEIRQWAKGSPDSPKTWEEAQGCQNNLVEKLHQRFALRCGGNLDDPRHALKDYGVFLEKVTIGSISPKGDIVRVKELKAKERLENEAEIADFNTQLEIAEAAAKALDIPIKMAFEKTQEYAVLRSTKTGGVYKISIRELDPLIEFLRRGVMPEGGKS